MNEEFIEKLENAGIYVVSNVNYLNYTDALEDIVEAFLEIVDDLPAGESYLKAPSKEKLMEAWKDSGLGAYDAYDKELATSFYYSDCIEDALGDDAYEFLDWLSSWNRFFTYVSVCRLNDDKFYDLIEYHPLTNLSNGLLDDEDELEKKLFID